MLTRRELKRLLPAAANEYVVDEIVITEVATKKSDVVIDENLYLSYIRILKLGTDSTVMISLARKRRGSV